MRKYNADDKVNLQSTPEEFEKGFKKVYKAMEETITHDEMKEEIGLDDNVNQPSHYLGEVEVIDYIKDKLTSEQFEGYCMGNVLKYVSRYQGKNGTEDLEKAQVYLKWAVEERIRRNT